MAKCVYSGAETVLELVGNEVRVARLHSTAGAMGEAERHVLVALQLVDTAPRDSLPRIVRGHIGEAGLAIKPGNSRLAASELAGALRSLEEPVAESK